MHTWRTFRRKEVPGLALISLVCVTLVPFFLPNMRERYYYPADTLALVLAFMVPSLWFFPILFQVISLLSYSIFLWAAPSVNVQVAAVLSVVTLILLLRQQYLWRQPEKPGHSTRGPSQAHRSRRPRLARQARRP